MSNIHKCPDCKEIMEMVWATMEDPKENHWSWKCPQCEKVWRYIPLPKELKQP